MALIYVVEDDKNIQDIETFALAIGTDFFGFSLQMWYAFIPAAVFVVCQLVHCAKESKRCYFDLAAKIL